MLHISGKLHLRRVSRRSERITRDSISCRPSLIEVVRNVVINKVTSGFSLHVFSCVPVWSDDRVEKDAAGRRTSHPCRWLKLLGSSFDLYHSEQDHSVS